MQVQEPREYSTKECLSETNSELVKKVSVGHLLYIEV